MTHATYTSSKFSHGSIAMMDSFLRSAIQGQAAKYPLSTALFVSAKLKSELPALVYKQGRICVVARLGSVVRK